MRFLPEAFKRLASRPAVIKYPSQKPKIHPGFRGKHVWDPGKCIFCMKCMTNCPTGAIVINLKEKTYTVNLGKCIFCGMCQEVCPVPGKAIRLSEEYEMAATDRRGTTLRMGSASAPKTKA
jgi:hydrogenase-4 component H